MLFRSFSLHFPYVLLYFADSEPYAASDCRCSCFLMPFCRFCCLISVILHHFCCLCCLILLLMPPFCYFLSFLLLILLPFFCLISEDRPGGTEVWSCLGCVFVFKATAPTEIYTLSLHDALPIFLCLRGCRLAAW